MDTPKVTTIVKNASMYAGQEFLDNLQDEQFELLKKLAFDFGFKKITFVYDRFYCQQAGAYEDISKNVEKARSKKGKIKNVKISLLYDQGGIQKDESKKDEYGVSQYTETKFDKKIESYFGDTPTE